MDFKTYLIILSGNVVKNESKQAKRENMKEGEKASSPSCWIQCCLFVEAEGIFWGLGRKKIVRMCNESKRKSGTKARDKKGQSKCRRLYMYNDCLQSHLCLNRIAFIATILSVVITLIMAEMKCLKVETPYPRSSLICALNISFSL